MDLSNGYIALIVNTKAGATSKKTMVIGFIDYLLKKGFKTKIDYTRSLSHAKELAQDAAAKNDCSMVIVAGGDGTMREAIEGMLGRDKPLMILPCGTENLLASELGYRKTLECAISTFESQILRPLDLGKANDYFFTSVGGVGFDGEVVKLVDEKRKGNITQFHYLEPIWKVFWTYDFPKLTVEADGEIIFSDRGIIVFGNVSRYAIGLPIMHLADFGDGLLDVCICRCSGKIVLAQHAILTLIKCLHKSKKIIYKQCKKFKIYSDTPLRTELDGDPGPDLPIEVTVIPHAVKVLVPPKAKPIGMRSRIFRIFK